MIAYCWATGQIDFGRSTPDGAIEIASGPAKLLRKLIETTSRLAYDNRTLLVPGVPEAPDQRAALKALSLHLRWLKRLSAAGVVIASKQPPLPLTRSEKRLAGHSTEAARRVGHG